MRITDALTVHDLALRHEPTDALILGDTHIGEESALNDQGVLLPQFAFQDLYKRTQRILDATQPSRILLNGDVKHNFGRISKDEWDNTYTYIELLRSHGDLTIIRGNHDVLLDPITDEYDIDVAPHECLQGVFVAHGHEDERPKAFKDADTVVLGHEHPAITLRDGERAEQYKAYVKGRLDDKTVVLMPSMNQLREGSDLLQEQLLSPYLEDFDLLSATITLIGEDREPFRFGALRNLKQR